MELEGGAVSAFPAPPDRFKHYASEQVDAGMAWPPPPPIQGHYVTFGEENNTEEQIIKVPCFKKNCALFRTEELLGG